MHVDSEIPLKATRKHLEAQRWRLVLFEMTEATPPSLFGWRSWCSVCHHHYGMKGIISTAGQQCYKSYTYLSSSVVKVRV